MKHKETLTVSFFRGCLPKKPATVGTLCFGLAKEDIKRSQPRTATPNTHLLTPYHAPSTVTGPWKMKVTNIRPLSSMAYNQGKQTCKEREFSRGALSPAWWLREKSFLERVDSKQSPTLALSSPLKSEVFHVAWRTNFPDSSESSSPNTPNMLT